MNLSLDCTTFHCTRIWWLQVGGLVQILDLQIQLQQQVNGFNEETHTLLYAKARLKGEIHQFIDSLMPGHDIKLFVALGGCS